MKIPTTHLRYTPAVGSRGRQFLLSAGAPSLPSERGQGQASAPSVPAAQRAWPPPPPPPPPCCRTFTVAPELVLLEPDRPVGRPTLGARSDQPAPRGATGLPRGAGPLVEGAERESRVPRGSRGCREGETGRGAGTEADCHG